jgi:LPS-assembly protein
MAGYVKVSRGSGFGVGDFVSRGALLLFVSIGSLTIAAGNANAVVEKKFISPITKKPVAGTHVDVEADRVTYDQKSKIATATGTVRITYGPYILVATRVSYSEKTGEFKANGSVELREPNGNILEAETADLRNKFKQGFARHVRALLTNDVTIKADYANRIENGITIYEHVHYTACKNCESKSGGPLWEIVSEKVVHDSKKKNLYYTNPTLKIGGFPVAWAPYAVQPDPTVRRRSGFLPPDYRHGDAYGFGVVVPYFQELGDSADLTYSPVLTTKQGPVADVEFRQALQSGRFNVRGYGVHQFTRDSTSSDQKWRGAVRTAGDFKLNDVWNWGWDGTLTSDRTFLDHYDFDQRLLATSQVYITGRDDRNYFSAQALHFKALNSNEIQDNIPTALPYINSEYTFDNAVFGGELGFDWSAYSLAREDANTPFSTINHGTDQTRAVANVHWQKQMINGLGQVITPFARMRSDLYVTDNVPDPTVASGFREREVTNRILPSAGFDMRWPFMASYDAGQSIITPVVQAIAATDETDIDKIGNEDAISVNFDSSSLFLQDRFTGQDRYEGGSRANVGVLYSFLGANGGYARASLGESFHIAGKNNFALDTGLAGTKSDLVGAFVIQPRDNLVLSYQARVEEDLSKINVQEAFANYNWDKFTGSLGYLNVGSAPTAGRPNALQQVEANTSFQFSEAWSVFGGLKYDLNNDQFVSKTAGIAFDCDCMSARLSYTETTALYAKDPTDRRLSLSVELRTLGRTSVSAGL